MRYIRLIRKSTNHRLFPARLPRLAMAFPPVFASARVLPTSLDGRRITDKLAQPSPAFGKTPPPAREVAMAVVPCCLAYHRERGFRRREGGYRARERRMSCVIEQDRHTRRRAEQQPRHRARKFADFRHARTHVKQGYVVKEK